MTDRDLTRRLADLDAATRAVTAGTPPTHSDRTPPTHNDRTPQARDDRMPRTYGDGRTAAGDGDRTSGTYGDDRTATGDGDRTDHVLTAVLPVVPEADGGEGAGGRAGGSVLESQRVAAWFGSHQVLEDVSLRMESGQVTALIGPSGCGKSTFLRILNRMHELVPNASLAGEVLLDGADVYAPERRITETRKRIGMVFQKPNPFPAMSIAENVTAGLKLTGVRAGRGERARLIEECLTKAGLWKEVRDRLGQPGGALSGGQQQRLCIARSLAVRPDVLLMDEPCSALDPTSTRRIEETIHDLRNEVTIVIVTHNMQQAARVSQTCAFFLAEDRAPGRIIESGPTATIFTTPADPRTADYVEGRFG